MAFANTDTTPETSNVPEPSAASLQNMAIKEFCDTFAVSSETPSSLGFLGPHQGMRLWLETQPMSTSAVGTEKLSVFILNTPSRYARMSAGYSMLITLITLGPTPWISSTWDRSNVFFSRIGGLAKNGSYSAFLAHSTHDKAFQSRHTTLAVHDDHPATMGNFARTLLFNIGVLLMELVFGDTLEQQSWRKEYLDGVTGEPNDVTDLCTALRWQKQVETEFGDKLAEAIRRCIVCSFDSTDLGSMAFMQAVWRGVVEPVEAFLSAWGDELYRESTRVAP